MSGAGCGCEALPELPPAFYKPTVSCSTTHDDLNRFLGLWACMQLIAFEAPSPSFHPRTDSSSPDPLLPVLSSAMRRAKASGPVPKDPAIAAVVRTAVPYAVQRCHMQLGSLLLPSPAASRSLPPASQTPGKRVLFAVRM